MNIPVVSAKQMAEVDRRAVEDYGVQIAQLMENAARSVVDFVREQVFPLYGKRIVCLVGKGNNGGDAVAFGRHAANAGAQVTIVLATPEDQVNELSRAQIEIVRKMGVGVEVGAQAGSVSLSTADLVVDGLLGYNIKGSPSEDMAGLIILANGGSAPILSYDVPSGLDPDKGKPSDPTIRAKWTVTLALPKKGLLEERARDHVGELYLADISVPFSLYQDMGIEVPAMFSERSVVKIGI